MSGPIYGNGKRDEAEAGVVAAFRAGGATVAQVSGRDLPDLLVGYLRETHLVEVKTNRAKLRPGQQDFARSWLGSPVVVARTPAQARKWLAVWRDRREGIATLPAPRNSADGPESQPINGWDAAEAAERETLPHAGKDPTQPA